MKRILTLFVVLTVVLGFWQSSLGAGRRPPATEGELKGTDKRNNQENFAGSQIAKSEKNEKSEKLKEIKNQLEKKFNTKIDIENIAVDPNFVSKVFLTDEKEIKENGRLIKKKKLIFLNEDESVKKEIDLIEKKMTVIKKGENLGDDIVSFKYDYAKFSKNKNLIARRTISNETKRKSLEGSETQIVTIYDTEGNIILEKTGLGYKFPLDEILFSNDDKYFALYYYSSESGLEWIEFYDMNGNKINEYQPPKEWESLNPVVTIDNYLLIKSVIVKGPPSSRKEVNLKIDFQGNIVEKGK